MTSSTRADAPSRPPGRLSGKVAFIAGAAAGIGAATARIFAREGAAVALADINLAAAKAVGDEIAAGGGQALVLKADVASEESVAAASDAAASHFEAIHVLFNCAGGSLPVDAPVTDVDLGVWDTTMTLDVRGTILTCRSVIPHLIAAGGGTIVNMSSGAALRGSGKAHIYAAAKGAIISLTRTLAGTYARHNIRANAICSGRVNTERVRSTYGIPGRPGSHHDAMRVTEQVKEYPFWFGEPDDIANIALFLASDESRMITGAAIPADGGRSAY
ncbi:SDR family NAD(P)-dependent oxidoreductase [uncultured Enterovirga sp.]|uniref:SDR family NAD(P)-dependent oxidoreductase n=1 Tax=uncultured Enterovirga sp. TaxID=2026352 RepID=UPI0035CC12B2